MVATIRGKDQRNHRSRSIKKDDDIRTDRELLEEILAISRLGRSPRRILESLEVPSEILRDLLQVINNLMDQNSRLIDGSINESAGTLLKIARYFIKNSSRSDRDLLENFRVLDQTHSDNILF